jgi:alkanesulfonate monooxygenase SsuD/methylene tetrahydromethanopterin reductase-like flavin-dependent oxidoreductase (luciferase family)
VHGGKALPKIGIGRIIVVAPSDQEALRIARRAYPVWHQSFTHLFRLHGRAQVHPRPPDFDSMVARGQAIAGTPATVAKFLAAQIEDIGCNYVLGQFAFGDVTLGECLRSIELFAGEVMPMLRARTPSLANASAG